ncbi:hypothetical protein HZ326_20728 [Fusarium oxysporum f. sp. albedinis]|nr:hypothetical protein HZ326_20728 [Fusarium oxysporum f. sp. albedinis]
MTGNTTAHLCLDLTEIMSLLNYHSMCKAPRRKIDISQQEKMPFNLTRHPSLMIYGPLHPCSAPLHETEAVTAL